MKKPVTLTKTVRTLETAFFPEWPYVWFAEDGEPCWVVHRDVDVPSEFLNVLDLMSEAMSECMWCENPIGRARPLGMNEAWIPCALVRRDDGDVIAECVDCAPLDDAAKGL